MTDQPLDYETDEDYAEALSPFTAVLCPVCYRNEAECECPAQAEPQGDECPCGASPSICESSQACAQEAKETTT